MNWKRLINPIYVYNKRDEILPNLKDISERSYNSIVRKLASCGFPVTENEKKLLAMKNKYSGRRCFVICNGPSLKMEDLQKIHENKDLSIASNKIFLAFDKTDWRPDYYTIVDRVVMENNLETVNNLKFIKIFPNQFKKMADKNRDTLFCYMDSINKPDEEYVPGFSSNIINGIFDGKSVTYWNIQLANYFGCREIYLTGMDFSFTVPEKKIEDKTFGYVLVSDGSQNHFCKDYRPAGETWTMPLLKEQEMACYEAKKVMEKNGGKIFNASRKTKLEVFEKVDFDSLF